MLNVERWKLQEKATQSNADENLRKGKPLSNWRLTAVTILSEFCLFAMRLSRYLARTRLLAQSRGRWTDTTSSPPAIGVKRTEAVRDMALLLRLKVELPARRFLDVSRALHGTSAGPLSVGRMSPISLSLWEGMPSDPPGGRQKCRSKIDGGPPTQPTGCDELARYRQLATSQEAVDNHDG